MFFTVPESDKSALDNVLFDKNSNKSANLVDSHPSLNSGNLSSGTRAF